MIWFLIIAAIIFYFLWSFNYDKKEILSKRENKKGSMQKRYAFLINVFKENESLNILEEEKDKLVLKINSKGITSKLIIIEFYKIIVIELTISIKTLVIDRRKWEFPINTNQFRIAEIIKFEGSQILDYINCPFYGKTFYSSLKKSMT